MNPGAKSRKPQSFSVFPTNPSETARAFGEDSKENNTPLPLGERGERESAEKMTHSTVKRVMRHRADHPFLPFGKNVEKNLPYFAENFYLL